MDDNAINLEIAEEILSDTGAVVDTARDGREAVERFACSPSGYYAMILMDIQMPVMNGYEATKAIRHMNRADADQVLVFAMTADAFADDIVLCEAGWHECSFCQTAGYECDPEGNYQIDR